MCKRPSTPPLPPVPESTFLSKSDTSLVGFIAHANEEELLVTAPKEVRVRVAADSGACDNVINPDELPEGAVPDGNPEGKHFSGASNEHIENYGKVDTLMNGNMACEYKACDVGQALHSISKICGPEDGLGLHDAVFTNKKCTVIPPGLLANILEKIKPVMEYHRSGGLYVADVTWSSFARQGRQE